MIFSRLFGSLGLAAALMLAVAPGRAAAFSLVPKEAVSFGAGLGVLGVDGVSFDARAELPPYGQLSFLSFIPGFGMDLLIGYDGGLMVQNALCVRVMPIDKLVAKAGLGLGVVISEGAGVYVPVVAGAKYFLTEKVYAEGHLSVPTNYPEYTRISVSAGFGFGYFKKAADKSAE